MMRLKLAVDRVGFSRQHWLPKLVWGACLSVVVSARYLARKVWKDVARDVATCGGGFQRPIPVVPWSCQAILC